MNKILACFFALVAGVTVVAAVETVPYGHPDFYPTPQRPLGFAGDGNSWFPGATPVYEFWSGRPKRITLRHEYRGRAKDVETWDIDEDPATAKNILWKQKTHSWSNSYPIRVGGKVFTLSNPSTLECFDAETGKLLWSFTGNPWLAKGIEMEKAEKAWQLYQVYLACPSLAEGSSTVGRGLELADWQHVQPILRDTTYPNLLKTLKELDPDHDYQAAADADLGIVAQQIEQWQAAKGESIKPRKFGFGKLRGEISQRINEITGEGRKSTINLNYSWQHAVGNMTSPGSDGTHVYFQTANLGANYCVDLDGNLVWQNHVESKQRTTCQSPLVVDGVYISVLGYQTLYGFDAETGEKLWEAPTLSPVVAETSKIGGYFVGSHAVVPLKNDTLEMNVIVTTLCNIIRPKDGKIIGHVPWTFDRVGGGSTLIHSGNVVLRGFCCDGFGGFIEGFRLTLVSEDKVIGEKIAKYPGAAEYSNQVATDGYFINNNSRGGIFTPEGEVLYDRGRDLGEICDMVAGTLYFWCDSRSTGDLSAWKQRRGDGKACALFHCRDLSNPRDPLALSDRSLLGGSDFPNMPAMQKYTPELYADPWYASSTWGKPAHRLNTDNAITAHGDKLYIRTIDALYCIGPAVKGRATDDPKVVEAIRGATTAEAVAKCLASPSAQYRYEAVKRLAGLERTPAIAAQLQEIAANDDYQKIRAAAMVALGMQPDQPGGKLLHGILSGAFDGHRWQLDAATNAILYELTGAMIPVLLGMLKDEAQDDRYRNNPQVQAAAAVCARLNPTSNALRDQLITCMRKLEDIRNGDQLRMLADALGNFSKDEKIIAFYESIPADDGKYPQFEIYAYLFKVAAGDAERIALIEKYQHSAGKHAQGRVLRHAIAQSLHNAAILKWLKDQAAEGNEAVIGTLNESQAEMRAMRLMKGVLQSGSPYAVAQAATYRLSDRDEGEAAFAVLEKAMGRLEGEEHVKAVALLSHLRCGLCGGAEWRRSWGIYSNGVVPGRLGRTNGGAKAQDAPAAQTPTAGHGPEARSRPRPGLTPPRPRAGRGTRGTQAA